MAGRLFKVNILIKYKKENLSKSFKENYYERGK